MRKDIQNDDFYLFVFNFIENRVNFFYLLNDYLKRDIVYLLCYKFFLIVSDWKMYVELLKVFVGREFYLNFCLNLSGLSQ